MFTRNLLILGLAVAMCACSHGKSSDYDTSGMTSIANGAITLRRDEVKLRAEDAPLAIISPQGDFSIDDKQITVTAAQRANLVIYYNAAHAVHDHGLETGMAGAAMGGAAIKGIAEAAIHGDSSKIDQAVNSQTAKIETAAAKICTDLLQMQAAQDALAASLTEFKPYAGILTGNDDGDCGKHKGSVRTDDDAGKAASE